MTICRYTPDACSAQCENSPEGPSSEEGSKQAGDDYLVFYGGLSAIPLTILSNAPQKLVECRKSRNLGKIMRSTRQVYEPVYAEDDIVGARRPTSTPPSRKKNGAAGNPPAAPFETHCVTHEQTPTSLPSRQRRPRQRAHLPRQSWSRWHTQPCWTRRAPRNQDAQRRQSHCDRS